MRKKPKHPCPYPCHKRKVGCRSTCDDWIDYEKDHFDWLAEKEKEIKAAEDVAMYKRDSCSKSSKQKRSRK